MSQILKRFILIIAVAAMTWTSSAFSLLGPFDTWQTAFLGYNPLNADLGGPKFLGEEWRWGISEITYGFDQSFIEWFGTNGMRAVDDAFAAYNRELTNLSGLTTAGLLAKPAQTRRVNLTAASLSLIDLKTTTMGLIAEQLGLATADRWVWALRARAVLPGITNWLVVPFNYDPISLKPSSYINGIRYSYHIESFPGATFTGIDFEDAVENLVDQTQLPYAGAVSSLVSDNPFSMVDFIGEYFPSLTRDDIGGLKYIYQSGNVNREDVPTNTFQIVADTAVQFIQGIDAYTFFTNAAFSSPSQLLAQFTNLVILRTNLIGITNIVSTNVFVTNITASTLFTDRTTLTIISNLDLFTFSEASRTNPPNVIRALYPGVIITSTNSVPVYTLVPVLTLTNAPGGVAGDPPIVVTNYVTQIVPNYTYTFANVITNYASAFTDVQTRDIILAPYGSPNDPIQFRTNVTVTRVAIPSGGFYILDRATNANLIAYSLTDPNGVPLLRTTNFVTLTNLLFFDPLTLRTIVTANVFTNVVYAAYPVFLNANLGTFMATNFVTNISARFDYTFGNLLYFPPANGNTNLTLQLSELLNGIFTSSTTTIPSDFPMGTVLILDTNQFRLIRDASGNFIRTETYGFATNILINFTNAVTGDFILEQLIRQTNNTVFAANAILFQAANGLALRPGVNSLHFSRIPSLEFLDQANTLVTNVYLSILQTNGVNVTNVFRRIGGPDLLFRAGDIGTTADPLPLLYSRTVGWPGTPTQGPGLIQPGQTIIFNKLRPSWYAQGPGFNTEETAIFTGAFGSFDGKTITPIVYPEPLEGPANTNLLKALEDVALGRTPRP